MAVEHVYIYPQAKYERAGTLDSSMWVDGWVAPRVIANLKASGSRASSPPGLREQISISSSIVPDSRVPSDESLPQTGQVLVRCRQSGGFHG